MEPRTFRCFFGEVCLEAWQRNSNDFGREVMNILEEKLGRAELEEALSAPIVSSEQKQLVKAS